MGKSDKNKKKRQRRSSSGDSDGEDGGDSSSSGRSESSGERHQRKRHKEKRHKKHKKADSKEKRKLKEARKFLRAHLKEQGGDEKQEKVVEMVPVAGDFPMKPISSEDYFVRNHEFSKWLKEQKRLTFNELSSEETHALFGEFVEVWNARRLSEEYYTGQLGAVARTSYDWGLGSREEREREQRLGAQQELRAGRKAWRGEQKELLDELLPRATGREAVLEKKAARRENAREREISPEMNRLIGGGDIMGGDDSFEAAKQREQRRQQFRTSRQTAKVEEAQMRAATARANEDARMAAFRELAQKGPILIPKRQ